MFPDLWWFPSFDLWLGFAIGLGVAFVITRRGLAARVRWRMRVLGRKLADVVTRWWQRR